MSNGWSADKLYVRATQGVATNWRWTCVWITQLVFYGLPWLNWHGRQMVWLDFAGAKFYLFGAVLWPQDGIYFAAMLILCACALFLSSALGGRLWCGFGCPHTVYAEIFMWIERKIEGGRSARMRLDQAALSPGKAGRKALKHGVWLLAAGWTGFTFVGYFTPIRPLLEQLASARLGGWPAFWIGAYGLLAYGNAGWLREQFCTYICPHARFQSVLSDSDTLVIAYDAARGEPRGLRNRKQMTQQRRLGDCVDCTLCVQVCPTGSDIRQGFHYACIGCAACIDACNLVMDKIGAPRGLIRYVSENALRDPDRQASLWRTLLRPRVLAYGAALLALAGAVGAALLLRSPLRVDVLLDRGTMARQAADGMIENVYRLQVMNMDERPHRYRIAVSGAGGVALAGSAELELDRLAMRAVPVLVRAPWRQGAPHSLPIVFRLDTLDGGAAVASEPAVFPMPR